MDTNKLDIASGNAREQHSPNATYKQIPEEDMGDGDPQPPRPKSLLNKDSPSSEPDGADERMLPEEDKKVSPTSKVDIAEVKFTTNDKQNGDAKLDIGEVKSEFVGLTKEELMKYANDPFWIRLRWVLFIGFWIVWAGMLVGAVMIIVAAPKCAPPEPKTWWEEGPLAVADSTADAAELDTLKTNGFMGLIVAYPEDTYKPLNDTEPFLAFLKLAEEKNLKVIVELTPGVSDMWFDKSEAKEGEFSDYYLWGGREGGDESKPPNNWLARDSTDETIKPAWKYSATRKQFYLSPSSRPQLNFRSKPVSDNFKNVLTNFLDAGADGIRIRGAPYLFVDQSFADEALASKAGDYSQGNYNFYSHAKTENLPEIATLLMQWRDLVKNKTENGGVFTIAENLGNLDSYMVNGTLVVDLPRHSQVFSESGLTAQRLDRGVGAAIKLFEDKWPLWEVNSSELPLGVLEPVAYLLKGSAILPKELKLDQELVETRKSPSIIYGVQHRFLVANQTVFAYVRVHPGNPGFVVAINPSDERVVVDFPKDTFMVPEEVTVQYLSKNYNESTVSMRVKSVSNKFPMSPKSSVVLSYVPKE